MNSIGIVGGNGIHATTVFYEKLLFKAKSSRNAIPELLIYSLPLTEEIESKFVKGEKNKEESYRTLFKAASKTLHDAGAEVVVMPCFSLTPILGSCCDALDLKILNPLYLLDDKLNNFNFKKLGILATPIGHEVIKNNLKKKYNVVPPKPSMQNRVNSLIDSVISRKCNSSGAGNDLGKICTEYSSEVDIIIIGCSELSTLKKRNAICIDLMDLLVDMTLDWWINKELETSRAM